MNEHKSKQFNNETTRGKNGKSSSGKSNKYSKYGKSGSSQADSGRNNPRGYSNHDALSAVRDSANDPRWYSRNPQLVNDAGSVTYADMLGLAYESREPVEGYEFSSGLNIVPGIMRLGLAPAVGVSSDATSAVNVMSRLMYSYVRHANSGSRNYESADLMTYVLAMGSCYAWYAELCRLYGLTRVYSKTNRYINRALITSMGYDYADIINNAANLRYIINQFAVKLNSFAVPNDFYYYDRAAFMPLHVWKDSQDDKSQLYYFQYDRYFLWSGTAYDTGSALLSTDFHRLALPDGTEGGSTKEYFTVSDISALCSIMIDGLMANEDIGLMSGDIYKAFKDKGLREVHGIAEDWTTTPRYDEMILVQIHNATVCGSVAAGFIDPINEDQITADYNAANVYQENGYLIHKPRILAGASVDIPKQILDAGFDNPPAIFNMEATRLKPGMGKYIRVNTAGGQESRCVHELTSCGTEFVTNATIFTIGDDGDLDGAEVNLLGIAVGSGFLAAAATLFAKTYFDWAPITYGASSAGGAFVPLGELFNYTTISSSVLSKLHDVALLSLFEVPGMAASV